ncbi:MAG: radical SAM protein [Candidatus Hydrogenedentes bacterium]|nr:radical SAM protein [Candidatus Hydrogenedentota bacterium]
MLSGTDTETGALDALDLKVALIQGGVQYPERVYEAVAGRARLAPPSNPFACNCLILPGEVAVHLNANPSSRYALDVDDSGDPALYRDGARVCAIRFPRASAYYEQATSSGIPYGGLAVLEGEGLLAFFYMWACEYVKTGETCNFCFQVRAEQMGITLPSATPDDVAEIIGWSVEHAGVKEVQLTAGSRFATEKECAQYAAVLRAVDEKVGLDRIASEIYCYMTAPKDPEWTDRVFAAGADRVAHDLHVWDPELHARIAPGHARAVGREAQLRSLEYIAGKHGPNKAFSAFVAGLEPLESMLEGAEYLARRGIVPAFSVWMPPAGTAGADREPPGADYYRAARREFARLYRAYGLVPPGIPSGSHVSMCRDIHRNMEAILAEA